MTATFVLVAPGEAGHAFPMLAVCEALVQRRNRVMVCASAQFAEATRSAGGEFVACTRYRALPERMAAAPPAPRWLPERLRPIWMYRRILVETVRDLVADVEAGIAGRPVDCIVGDFLTGMGAKYVAERRGLPYVSLGTTPFAALDARGLPLLSPNPIAQRIPSRILNSGLDVLFPLRRLRRELELPDSHRRRAEFLQLAESDQLHIVLAHPEFVGQTAIREHHAFVGPMSFAPSCTASPDLEIELGTVLVATTTAPRDPGVFARAVQAVAAIGVPVLATRAGATELPPDPGPHVRVIDFAPHEVVLPKVRALVTHGGWGTVSRALRLGVPMVIIPLFGDQPAIAARAAELGVAYHVPLRDATVEVIRDNVAALLRDDVVLARVRDVARRIEQLDPGRRTCELLEQLVANRVTNAVEVRAWATH